MRLHTPSFSLESLLALSQSLVFLYSKLCSFQEREREKNRFSNSLFVHHANRLTGFAFIRYLSVPGHFLKVGSVCSQPYKPNLYEDE